jgi:hypothetical protein
MISRIILKNYLRTIAASLGVAIGIAFLSTPAAFAQSTTSQNITMSPASTLLSAKAGTTVTKSFEILNSGGDSYDIVTSAAPYRVTGLEYSPNFTQLPGTTETSNWIKIANPSTVVGPQKAATINYSVTVPKNTAPGGYYAVLFAETRPNTETQGTGVVPRNRVGNILYITVEGPVETAGEAAIDSVSGFNYKTSIPLGFTVSNTGGIHFETTIKSVVKSITGKEVFSASIERYVLPQTKRYIAADWTPTSPIGYYTVSRSAIVAGKEKSFPDEKVLYIQPWVAVAVLALIASVIFYFASRASQRRKSSVKKLTKK